ncbi:MAG TPA: GGDEF domain-containing protein [Bosea sp. (in: a-proteobacteria)]
MAGRKPTESKINRRGAGNVAVQSRVKRGIAASAVKSVREKLLERSLRKAERQLQSLRSLAYHDELCGIYNRRAFNDELQRLSDMAQRYGGEAAIVMIDVDNLKTINDRHGHAVGDIALVAVAQVLKSSIRSSDVLARIGGDEFAVILHHIDETSAQTKIAEMRERVAATQINTVAGKLALTISLGHSMMGVGLAEEAMRSADHAMYRNKRAGRTIYQHT